MPVSLGKILNPTKGRKDLIPRANTLKINLKFKILISFFQKKRLEKSPV